MRRIVVEHGDTDVKLRDLAVEVPCHEALHQQFHTMHLRLNAAPAVVSAPSSPQDAAEVFGGPQDFGSHGGTGGDGLPRFGIPAGRADSVGAAIRDSIVALAGAVCTVIGHRVDLFADRDLAEQIGQDRSVTNVALGELDYSELERP